ncbi:MAG: CDP-diacylglycerol--serine O-phosphatidyltransferase [Bacillota bacterium]|nr:CDP-diacylglycerol--serine O-phosphatidyltransferase [Bacillota bacterium]
MAKNAVPNIFTFANLAFGILSILMTFEACFEPMKYSNYTWACIFIMLAAVVDRYDGRIARALNVSSDLGKELDSLADLVSFGVAPSILLFSLYNFKNLGIIGYLLALALPIAGAYRLARYNTSTFNNVFTGVPITVSGLFIAAYSLITMRHTKKMLSLSIFLILILSYLMISKLRIKKV